MTSNSWFNRDCNEIVLHFHVITVQNSQTALLQCVSHFNHQLKPKNRCKNKIGILNISLKVKLSQKSFNMVHARIPWPYRAHWPSQSLSVANSTLTALSSAISAEESSFKKHLLCLVLSMMLWKIHAVIVLFTLSGLGVRACMRVSALCLIPRESLVESNLEQHNYISFNPPASASWSADQSTRWIDAQAAVLGIIAALPSYRLRHYGSLLPQVHKYIDSTIGKAIVEKCSRKKAYTVQATMRPVELYTIIFVSLLYFSVLSDNQWPMKTRRFAVWLQTVFSYLTYCKL